VNDLDSFLSSDVEGAQFRRGTYENDPPGSTFKILTAAAAIEKDEEENLPDDFFTFTDTGSYTPEGSSWTITNWNDAVFGTVDLDTAFKNSVNCYFADLGIRIGQDRLLKTAQAFRIGKDIEIPFLCTLHSKTDLGDEQPVTIAQTAFGQGNTEITPVHLALIAQAVANDGVMLQPYVVSSVNSGNMPLYRAFPHKLGRSISHAVDVRLKELMHHAAENYGLTEDYYGMVYAKSGTAECANDRVHTYIVGFTEDASFCVSMNNGHASADLYGITQELVAYINRIYGH
jgi:cell division protein FtsI/penicillin-binding protein 2